MGILRILSSEGDYPATFTADAHAEAEALFKRLQSHYTPFKILGNEQPAVRLTQFDPTADEIVMVPKVQGG